MLTNKITFSFLLLLAINWIPAQCQSSIQTEVYQAFVTRNINTWENILQQHNKPSSQEDRYDRAMAIYGFLGLCADEKQKKRGKPYLEELLSISDGLLSENPSQPKYMALGAATLGLQLAYQMHKMMTVGPKSIKLLKKAEALGADIPQVLVELGNQAWVAPKVFGGDKELATSYYRRAIILMEKNPDQLIENWYYLKIHLVLADWYTKTGYSNRAQGIYLKVGKLEPGLIFDF